MIFNLCVLVSEAGTKHIECLLAHGAELNARTEWGDTAAHYAALSGSLEVLNFLCKEEISLTKPKIIDIEACRALGTKHGLSQVRKINYLLCYSQRSIYLVKTPQYLLGGLSIAIYEYNCTCSLTASVC